MNTTPAISPIRLIVWSLFLSGATVALILRLGYLQVINYQEYRERAVEEHSSRQTVMAPRGSIKDRNGHPLALTVPAYDVLVNRKALGDQEAEAVYQAISPYLGMATDGIRNRVKAVQGDLSLVKTGLDYRAGLELSRKNVPSVKLSETIQRSYPEGNMAATILGFIGRDQMGLMGIEADFNRELGGVPGSLVFERDSKGDRIPLGYRGGTKPVPGGDVVLTLDRYIQRATEEELDKVISQEKATGGTIIVMDPHTGAILAMASRPTFNINKLDVMEPGAEDLYRNRAITDLYEPGSTFKVITMASALNEGLVEPNTTYMDGGPLVKYGRVINTWNSVHYGLQTMTDLLVTSNNIGAAWVSERLGPDLFYQYVSRFGFGQTTNLGLSGEALGQVRTNKEPGWSPIDLASNSFGQGISVTPIQLITAVSAIANGGTLMRPYIVESVTGPKGERKWGPVAVRRVIAPQSAEKLKAMMHEAAEKGSLTSRVPNFKVAGKTGTADIPGEAGYGASGSIASFVGFAPFPDPKVVILVKVDRPGDPPWASRVASPVFSSLAQRIMVYLRVSPNAANSEFVLKGGGG